MRARRCAMLGQTRLPFVLTSLLSSQTFGSCGVDCNSTTTVPDSSDATGNPRATLGSHTVLGQTRPPIELTCPLSHPTFGSCRMDCKSSKTAWDRSDTTGMHARHHSMLGQTRPLFALMCQCCSLSCVVLETGCEGRTTHMHVLRHGAHACTWSDSVPSNVTAVCADVSALSSDLPVMAHGLKPHYNRARLLGHDR